MGRQIENKVLFVAGLAMVFCLILLLVSIQKGEVLTEHLASDAEVSEMQKKEKEDSPVQSAEGNVFSLENSTMAYNILPWTAGNSNIRSWALLVLMVFLNLTLLYRDDKRQRIYEKKGKSSRAFHTIGFSFRIKKKRDA